MAARTRASLTDDDSISDHLNSEMVRTKASIIIHNDPDEQATLNESGRTIGSNTIGTNDFLLDSNSSFTEGVQREYEIPNIFTYRKVS